MSDIIKISGKLALICMTAAIALAMINTITAPRIAEYQHQLLKQALSAVSGGLSVSEASEEAENENYPEVVSYYELADVDGTSGYILTITAAGYGGPMKLIAGYRTDGSVIDVRLLENSETPGLGKEAEKDEYMEVFAGKDSGSTNPIPIRKNQLNPEKADEISGATITFSGISKALTRGSDFVKILSEEK